MAKKKPTKKKAVAKPKRKPLNPEQKQAHALRQKIYIARKRVMNAESKGERMKYFKKVIELNSQIETLKEQKGIKSRRSSIEIKAEKRSGKGIPITLEFMFYEIKKAKEQVIEYVANGAKTINGISTKNMVVALNEVDMLFLHLDSESRIRITYDLKKKAVNVSILNRANEIEED